MLTVDEARSRMLELIKPLGLEKRGILESLNYVLADDIYSDYDIPPFDNSAMDGYAVIAEDLKSAFESTPVKLKVIEHIPAGHAPVKSVKPGHASRIMTGSMVPKGADAVVMLEVTKTDGNYVEVYEPVEIGENVRKAGESVKNGQLVMSKGKLIRPQEMAMLAVLNKRMVNVVARPKVAIISTGDELVELGEELKPGKIRECNRYGLYGQVITAGGFPIDLGICKDDASLLEEKVKEAVKVADALVTSGGVSVGDYDVVKDVISKLGEIDFWRVAMRPGKPLAFGFVNSKPIFGLPGNPVSSLVVFEIFVRAALLKMAGRENVFRPHIRAIAENPIKGQANRVDFQRAIITQKDGKYYAKTTGSQGSGVLYSLVVANGLVTVPMGAKVKAGDEVEAELFSMLEE